MSRIVVTNMPEAADKIDRCLIEAGFPQAFEEKAGTVRVMSYYKLNNNGGGFFYREANGGGYICNSGTLIYDGKTGVEALQDMYKALTRDKKTIQEVRAQMYGSFVVAYAYQGALYVFTDETSAGSYYYYYDEKTEDFLASNQVYHIAKYAHCKLLPMRYAEFVANPWRLFTNQTLYSNIKELMADECLHVDLNSGHMRIEHVELNNYETKFSSIEEAVNKIAAEIDRWSEVRDRLFENRAILTSGGSDTRVTLASYMKADKKPALLAWQGRDTVTFTNKEDQILGQRLADMLGVPYDIHDAVVAMEEDYPKIQEKDFDRWGEVAMKYGFNKKWFKIFEDGGKDVFFDSGSRGEAFGTVTPMDPVRLEKHTIRDIDLGDIGEGMGLVKDVYGDYDKMVACREKELQDYYKKFHLDISDTATKDRWYLLHRLECRNDRWSLIVSNLVGYGSRLMDQKRIEDLAFSLPAAWMDEFKFKLRLIQKMAPQLLEVPFYCRCRMMEFDPQKLELVEMPNIRRREKIKDVLRVMRVLPILKAIRDKVAPVNDDRYEEYDKVVRNYCASELKNRRAYKDINMKIEAYTFGYLPILAESLMVYLKMDDFIQEENDRFCAQAMSTNKGSRS